MENEKEIDATEVFGLTSSTFVLDNKEQREKEKKEALALRKILSKLSEKEMRFVEGYIKTLNASEAYRMTGIPVKDYSAAGYQMMQKPAVQTAIAIALKRRIEAIGLDETSVITDIKRVYNEAMEKDKFDVALKAVELLGIHIGMFKKQTATEGKIKERINSDMVKKEILSSPGDNDFEDDGESRKEKLNNVLNIIQRNRTG